MTTAPDGQDYVADTRSSYDAMAEAYADFVRHELDTFPVARAMLAVFAELVLAGGGGPVLDAGCGVGRICGHLGGLGLDVSGVDLSPGMLAIARRDHPDHAYTEGSLLALPAEDASYDGALAWYSLIHVPPADQPRALAELHRVLRPGGHLLLAFQVGDEPSHRTDAAGIPVRLTFHRINLDAIQVLLRDAGFDVVSTTWREREPAEKSPQGIVLARKPVA